MQYSDNYVLVTGGDDRKIGPLLPPPLPHPMGGGGEQGVTLIRLTSSFPPLSPITHVGSTRQEGGKREDN